MYTPIRSQGLLPSGRTPIVSSLRGSKGRAPPGGGTLSAGPGLIFSPAWASASLAA